MHLTLARAQQDIFMSLCVLLTIPPVFNPSDHTDRGRGVCANGRRENGARERMVEIKRGTEERGASMVDS